MLRKSSSSDGSHRTDCDAVNWECNGSKPEPHRLPPSAAKHPPPVGSGRIRYSVSDQTHLTHPTRLQPLLRTQVLRTHDSPHSPRPWKLQRFHLGSLVEEPQAVHTLVVAKELHLLGKRSLLGRLLDSRNCLGHQFFKQELFVSFGSSKKLRT